MPVEIRKLTHVYMAGTPFETKALDEVSFKIADGKFIGIIGHTGSGKSTLIAHFNALIKPPQGTVIVNGQDLGAGNVSFKDVRQQVGLVFQYPEYQLFEETIYKDVAFGPGNLKLSEDEIKTRVVEALNLVGLDESYFDRSPFELSGGQKRRVAIAGVLAMKPGILVLDEPAAGLDPAGRREILSLVKGIHESGVTVVMVSHSMDDVGELCDRLIVLNHGKVAFEGTPSQVFSHAKELEEIGLGVPECAKLAARLRENGFDIPEGTFRQNELKKAILAALGKGVNPDA